jgi:phage terminase large subunit GpA-like protein
MNSALFSLHLFAPPPRLTVSEWADAHRKLSPESSAEPGQWVTARAEYQRGIMDAVNDPTVETVVVMSSAQVGKTEALNNIVGYFIDQDPAPMLLVQPTLDMAQAWSKDRLAPMLRDSPRLQDKVRDVRSRDAGNTILHKTFPGGHITMAGANSAASLASRPVRVVLCDEVDRYPVSAGTEGDPVNLASKRSTTFWNRKRILVSTPTIKGLSRIESAYEASDQRKFYVPCPSCAVAQTLKWAQVRWESGQPETAKYVCEACGVALDDADKLYMLKHGTWKAEGEFRGTAGFWINELYSPWVPWRKMVATFLEVKDKPEEFRTFVNTSWGETWEERGEKIEHSRLYESRESYAAQVPDGVVVLTAALDVQDDRIEAECVGWGAGEESWSIDYQRWYGSPATAALWEQVELWLTQTWTHEQGLAMKIQCATIDSGGHHTKEVYAFVKPRQVRRVYAIKGANQPGHPLVKPSNRVGGVRLFLVGVDTAKDTLFSRLKLDAHGPGYCHFPRTETYGDEYFQQLTAEEKRQKFERGVLVGYAYKKIRSRNEALDLKVYNMAALAILNPNLPKLAERITQQASAVPAPAPVASPVNPLLPVERPRRPMQRPRSNFVGRWR